MIFSKELNTPLSLGKVFYDMVQLLRLFGGSWKTHLASVGEVLPKTQEKWDCRNKRYL
jgi:hypothetical protein